MVGSTGFAWWKCACRVVFCWNATAVVRADARDRETVAYAVDVPWYRKQRGEFATLEAMLDPDVELLWWDAGEWDFHGRGEVMRLLRQRYQQGFAGGELELVDAGNDTIVTVSYPARVGGPGWPPGTTTVIRFRNGRAVQMQQYGTREEAFRSLA
jgi:hypothetical protein